MRHISMREANQSFARCIAEVEGGAHLVVERRGIPVAEIIPFRRVMNAQEREAAWQEMLAILEEGIPLGGVAPTKDEMHEH